jgi:phosphatidate cytidylyltransferase
VLGTRVVVGIVLGALAVVVIVHGGLWFFGMMLALGLLGLSEFYRMVKRYRPLALAGFVALVVVIWAAWFHTPQGVAGGFAVGLLLAFVLGAIPGPQQGVTVRIALTMLGLVYLGLGFGSLELIRRLPDGLGLVLMVVFGTWAGDTVAYFTGRYFGATPMAPRLSPKKTWEGFAGGVIGTLVLVEFIGLYTFLSPLQSLELGLIIALVAPVGDLFESLVKRDAEIKDAGSFFPGHGGILDRFDALLFGSGAAYVFVTQVLGVA